MNVKRVSDEVTWAQDPVVEVDRRFVETIRQDAGKSARLRSRLCAHKTTQDRLQEMIIVLRKGTYLRPHRHRDKVESFHIIEGRADVVTFDASGAVHRVVRLGDWASGLPFYYRNEATDWHTVVVRSDSVIFHETTNGPLDKDATSYAPWAPEEGDRAGVEAFMKTIDSWGTSPS